MPRDRKSIPTDEIEITPEMIAAGCRELSDEAAIDLYQGYLSSREVVEAIYLAMSLAQRASLKAG